MMRRILYFLITTLLMSSCSVSKLIHKEPELLIDESQMTAAIEKSIAELIEGQWMTDFLLQKNERPVIVISRIINNTKAKINSEKVNEAIEFAILNSGQARVVKTTESQRILNPIELAKVSSVDFVLSVTFLKNINITPAGSFIELSLWNESSVEPISTIKTEIE